MNSTLSLTSQQHTQPQPRRSRSLPWMGKTAKMYRGGAICLTVHFKPLWAKNRCSLPAQGRSSLKRKLCPHVSHRAASPVEASCHALQVCAPAQRLSQEQSRKHNMSWLSAPLLACSPRFGIGHAMCLGLAPWMAAEIPHMADNGVISNDA